MNNVFESDLLFSNSYDPVTEHQGYGLTDELQRFKLREFVENAERQKTPMEGITDAEPNQAHLEHNDLMNTNRVVEENGDLRVINTRRLFKEERRVFTISSRDRDVTNMTTIFQLADVLKYKSAAGKAWDLFYTIVVYYDVTKLYLDTLFNSQDPSLPALLENVNREYESVLAMATKFYGNPTGPVDSGSNLDGLFKVKYNVVADFIATFNPDDFHPKLDVLVTWLNSLLASYPSNQKLIDGNTVWEPFYESSNTIYVQTGTASPHYYQMTLEDIYNCKSVRLLSTTIPNTVANITPTNNLLFLNIQQSPVKGKSLNFAIVQLDVGQYDINALVTNLRDKLNAAAVKEFAGGRDDFKVTYLPSTGKISITLSSGKFHLKFFSELLNKRHKHLTNLTAYANELWYKLGFPLPCQFDQKGNDVYTSEWTNCVAYNHPLLDPLKLPKDMKEYDRPYRHPDIDVKEIYLVINDYALIATNFSKNNFSKILLNVEPGKIAYNTFIRGPYIFPTLTDIVTPLTIRWTYPDGTPVDFSGVDHTFVLEFIQYSSRVDANEYNTRMGYIDTSSYPEFLLGSAI